VRSQTICVLRRVFEPIGRKLEEGRENCKNERLPDLYLPPNTMKVIK